MGIKILKNDYDYIYLLDDDIVIKGGLLNFIENVFAKNNIPLISNINCNSEDTIIKNGIKYVKLKPNEQLYGNMLILDTSYVNKYGFFHILPIKWGFEHILFTYLYLHDTNFNNLGLYDLQNYIVNGESELHEHCNKTINYRMDEVMQNVYIDKEIMKNLTYNLHFANNIEHDFI